jgi:hypothetical protein
MKFEVGKFYKTRDGRKVEVIAVRAGLSFGHTVIGLVMNDPYGDVTTWSADGNYGICPDSRELSADLVAEWRDPVKVSGWLNYYKDDRGTLYTPAQLHCARKEADRAASISRVACIYVSGEEGKEP